VLRDWDDLNLSSSWTRFLFYARRDARVLSLSIPEFSALIFPFSISMILCLNRSTSAYLSLKLLLSKLYPVKSAPYPPSILTKFPEVTKTLRLSKIPFNDVSFDKLGFLVKSVFKLLWVCLRLLDKESNYMALCSERFFNFSI